MTGQLQEEVVGTDVSARPAARPARRLVPSLLAMMSAGLVAALDDILAVPTVVLIAALVVGATGIGAFFVAVWMGARANGAGVVRASGRAIRACVRMIVDLF